MLFSYSLHSYNRDEGHKVVDKVSYILATTMLDTRTATTFSYAEKQDNVVIGGVVLPEGAPVNLRSAPVLANRMEAETRKNAKLCRQAILALQCEFSLEENMECLLAYIQRLVDRYGCGAIWAIHKPSEEEGHDERNDHAHVIMTRREVTADGLGPKNKSFEALDHKMLSVAEVDWQRRIWMEIVNAMFARKGLSIRISCETLKKQGIDRIPQLHVGPKSRAMTDQGKPHESKPTTDRRGRITDWPSIDRGQSRYDFNADIVNLNEYRERFGPVPLEIQIHEIESHLGQLIEKYANLESLIPKNLLPLWARIKLEWGWYQMKALWERLLKEKHDEEEERKEDERRRERKGLHEQMRRMKEEIRRLEGIKRQMERVQKFFVRIEAHLTMSPPIKADTTPPPRVISNKQFNVELHFKAESARAQISPEYRPRIERPAPREAARAPPAGQGAVFEAAARAPPADNGGKATRPPPLTRNFNAQADPESAPYKAKVKLGFGPK